jgi:hypothetical protein
VPPKRPLLCHHSSHPQHELKLVRPTSLLTSG